MSYHLSQIAHNKSGPVIDITEQETEIPNNLQRHGAIRPRFEFLQHDPNGRRVIFPWLGVAALVASAATCFFSWLVLHVIDHHVEIHKSYLKPASWLSIILSGNSIFLHVALTEGLAIAWWYNASRSEAKVRDLHEIWAQGTSLASVLRSGRRVNYVALATIFVASIPLNGVLLQNAITLVPSIYVNQTSLSIPIAPSLQLGFSAEFNQVDQSIGTVSNLFSVVEQTASPSSAFATINAYPVVFASNQQGCGTYDTTGVCVGRVNATGFSKTCTTESVGFDLLPAHHPNQTFSYRVFASNVTWDPAEPNTIRTTWLYKGSTSCEGALTLSRCTLIAAKVSYPMQLFSSVELGAGSGLAADFGGYEFMTLNVNSTFEDDVALEELPVYPGEGIKNTTYGAIAAYLASEWDSSIDWTWNGSNWTVDAVGTIAKTLSLSNTLTGGGFSNMYGSSSLNSPGYCNNSFANVEPGGGLSGSLMLTMWQSLRQLMFFCNTLQTIYGYNPDAANSTPLDPQIIVATRTAPVLRYEILYRYWAGSLAVTAVIILIVMPTFYGFWTLTHRPSLSPAETAAAFHAAVVETDAAVLASRARLKVVGERYVHMQQQA